MIKKSIYAVLLVVLLAMVYMDKNAYHYALAYEQHTTELVSHQGAKERMKGQLSKWAKNILGDLYKDEKIENLEKLKALQNYTMQEAKRYTYYFMALLLGLLLSYFLISLRAFTLFGSLAAMVSLIFGLISPYIDGDDT